MDQVLEIALHPPHEKPHRSRKVAQKGEAEEVHAEPVEAESS
jgi:hypothetical protein